MRVTIFGATGLLGKALTREWRGDEMVAPARQGLGQPVAGLGVEHRPGLLDWDPAAVAP